MAPEGEGEGHDQENRREPAPGELAGSAAGAGFRAAKVCFIRTAIFASIVFGRYDFGRSGRRVAGSFQVVRDGLIFVEAKATGIGADEALVEDAPRQLVELILFQRLQHARPDFGGTGNLLQRDLALLALQLQFFAKGRQPCLSLSPDGERNFTLSRRKIIDYSVGTELRASSRELRANRAARGSEPGLAERCRLPRFVARAVRPNV